MKTFRMPVEPNDVDRLWDRDGDLWFRNEEGEWSSSPVMPGIAWEKLVAVWGPLTDVPEVKVGDVIGVDGVGAGSIPDYTAVVGEDDLVYQLVGETWHDVFGNVVADLSEIAGGRVVFVP